MSDSAGCRILVVSPTAARALQFVQRVQALSAARHGPPSAQAGTRDDDGGEGTTDKPQEQTSVSTRADPRAADSSTSIPWTIRNKYYTADVHFETHEFAHFRVVHAVGVPAIIYVWGPGEAYKEHVPEIAHKVQHYDIEVSLAVRFGETAPSVDPPPPSVDEDGIDEFLSSHGFEFVKGERAYRMPTQDESRHSDDEDSGIPGLPRVLDALSTIMWPSLIQSEATRQRKSRARDLIGWALEEEADDGLRALIPDASAPAPEEGAEAAAATAARAAKRKSRMQREMEELERWLEDEEADAGVKFSRGSREGKPVELDVDAAQDAAAHSWVNDASVASAEGWEDMLTPPAIHTPRGGAFPGVDEDASHAFGHRADSDSDAATEHGFEDDFADFVSAPGGPHRLGSGDERLLEVRYDVGRLTPMHTGSGGAGGMPAYHSLGSVSDFGADDSMSVGNLSLDAGAYGALDDDDYDEHDPDMPSRAEILETSRRLFGAAAFSPAPPAGDATAMASPTSTSATAGTTANATRSATPSAAETSFDADADISLETDDGDESFQAFDLSRVFSALQGMKDEIAGMEDEDERRRAAARVALGLVYGLGAGGDRPARPQDAATGQEAVVGEASTRA